MNPPAALYGAMSRERKPFTYTPGGLDLSEIKSERMAKRLMRNAMNQGVPEVPIQQNQTQAGTSNPVAVPNFNCLPVQVFPAFNLPANPKSLLRTRSHPEQPKQPPVQRVPQPSLIPKPVKPDNNAFTPSNNNNYNYSRPTVTDSKSVTQININNSVYQRPVSMYDYNPAPSDLNTLPRMSYESNEPTTNLLPEISYEAEYFQTSPRYIDNSFLNTNVHLRNENAEKLETNITKNVDTQSIKGQDSVNIDNSVGEIKLLEESVSVESKLENVNNAHSVDRIEQVCDIKTAEIMKSKENYTDTNCTINSELLIQPDNVTSTTQENAVDINFSIEPITTPPLRPLSGDVMAVDEQPSTENEQREVKVKKQVKKESKSDVQNGDQNGDSSVEAELTVKLPSKKSAAKTETKVEVVKKHLPDGSIEEIKTTTTKTTVDGKTTIATKTETTIIPKEEEEEEEEEIEEEEEQEEEESSEIVKENGDDEDEEKVIVKKSVDKPVENGEKHTIVTKEETSESTTTKKVIVVQNSESEEEEEIEEENEKEEVKPVPVEQPKEEPKEEVEEEVEEQEEIHEESENNIEIEEESKKEVKVVDNKDEEVIIEVKSKKIQESQEDVEEEAEEEYEEADEKIEVKKEKSAEVEKESEQKDEESEYTEEEYESEKEEVSKPVSVPTIPESEKQEPTKDEQKQPEPESETQSLEETKAQQKPEEQDPEEPEKKEILAPEPPEIKIPLREPSIPLEKVEDVEIKPIGLGGETITKSRTENTEIITNTDRGSGPISTQTEYNRIENIVTVNRTTKTLDNSYEQLTQHGVPTVKTYFAPNRERVSTSPQPSKPYQPIYPPIINQPTERRHSLLLDRLSVDRQIPPTAESYQNNMQFNNQSYEQQSQWSQEPQAEVLTVSNVKPSKITNQQWYQQSRKENIIYNNVNSTPASQTWTQSSLPSQPSQPSQPSPQPQPNIQSQPQYQPSSYTENTANSYQQNNYQSYTPKPTTWGNNNLTTTDNYSSTLNTQPSQYSFLNKNTSESYQTTTQNSNQQYSSSYVPPPWEQDSNYVVETSKQTYYQPPPLSTTFTPTSNQSWKPPPPQNKFSKTPPKSYIPPAPNQSFVKPVNTVEPPRVPGKKTYYSEYERRYITVPESNYIPGESKYQPQPDPSPQYYYDNNEPTETVEHEWRKELREFTEKSSQTFTDQTTVRPPWEEDTKYAKYPSAATHTPTWSQTLRPQSWRDRSFESEYVGFQELPKTNTLGRGRPLSSYAKNSVEPIPERARGVSVDRFNPNSYHSPIPAEHPPVQAHTLNVVPPAKSYHNPNVPAYHAHPRASAEPREVYPQSRQYGEARASPIQSRSFKYLQWITGTDE